MGKYEHQTDNYRQTRDLGCESISFGKGSRSSRSSKDGFQSYNAGWKSEMSIELLIDEDNNNCENGVESARYPDMAMDGTFGEAESERPSAFANQLLSIVRSLRKSCHLRGLWREVCANGIVDSLRWWYLPSLESW